MNRKMFSVTSIILHLFVELGLTLISSMHWSLLLISLVVYATLLYKELNNKSNPSLFVNHYLASLIFIIPQFVCILSYNKVLPWEIGLTVLFVVLTLHYSYRLGGFPLKRDLSWSVENEMKCGDCFTFSFRLPIGTQHDSVLSPSIVVIKFLVSNILLFAYTTQLSLTTVCTPEIYADWFLIIADCRYTYSTML